MTPDRAPAMIGQHTGFIAHYKGDSDFPKLLHCHCILHQQGICAKVISFVICDESCVKLKQDLVRSETQDRILKMLLQEMSAEYGGMMVHTEIQSLSRGQVLFNFYHF